MSKILYEVYKNDIKDSESVMYGKYYARLKSIETLNMPKLAKHISGHGSVFTNLKTDILKGYPAVKPERNVLEEFDSIVVPMFEEMRRIARENHKLSELRDSLLPRLMSGELDVSDLDI